MDVKSLHVQSVACPRMRTLVLQTMDFQSIVVDCFFGAVVLLSALIEKANTSGLLEIKAGFDGAILIGSLAPILLSIYAQRSFKLRTAL